MIFESLVRSFSLSCVKGFYWFVICSAFHGSFLLTSLSVDEEHSISLISPVASGTEIPGPCGTVLWQTEHQGISHVFCSSDLFLE